MYFDPLKGVTAYRLRTTALDLQYFNFPWSQKPKLLYKSFLYNIECRHGSFLGTSGHTQFGVGPRPIKRFFSIGGFWGLWEGSRSAVRDNDLLFVIFSDGLSIDQTLGHHVSIAGFAMRRSVWDSPTIIVTLILCAESAVCTLCFSHFPSSECKEVWQPLPTLLSTCSICKWWLHRYGVSRSAWVRLCLHMLSLVVKHPKIYRSKN